MNFWEAQDAKAKCLVVTDDGMKATSEVNLLMWDPEGVKAVLRSYNP